MSDTETDSDNGRDTVMARTAAIMSASHLKMPYFMCKEMTQTKVRDEWIRWHRGMLNIFAAGEITNPEKRKQLMLAWGGFELADVFYAIPGADGGDDDPDVFKTAVDALTKHFAPKQHDAYERHKFWDMKIESNEAIDKFLHRIRKQAVLCNFGTSAEKSREISIIDKIIASAPIPLREKLLQKEKLTLSIVEKTVNSYQAVKEQSKLMTAGNEKEIFVNEVSNRYGRNSQECSRCGYRDHDANDYKCPALKARCHRCNNMGHYQTKCTSRGQKRTASTALPQSSSNKRFQRRQPSDRYQRGFHSVKQIETQEDELDFNVYNIGECDDLIWCNVGGTDMEMCIDSGSKYNMIDDKTFKLMLKNKANFRDKQMDNTKKFLAYGRFPLKLLAVFDASIKVKHGETMIEEIATFYVIQNGQQPLLGKDTAKAMGLLHIGLPRIHDGAVFGTFVKKNTFPKISGIQIRIPVNPHVKPVQQGKRGCPAALFVPLKSKMDELLQLDIIEEAPEASEWVSPLVPVMKDNGEIRICVDMRRANEAILRENHPLPTMDELLAQLGSAVCFSKLDFKNGFHQVEIHPESRAITTFISPWGIYRYKRLCFGINCAPELFQKIVEQILVGCKNTLIFIDDIVVYGKTEAEHDEALRAVLAALKERNVLLNPSKCEFKKPEIVFLGHKLSKDGVRPTEDKVEAIRKCREPNTKEELRSFLGLVTYLSRFLPDLTTTTAPLRDLLKKKVPFHWSREHSRAFIKLKEQVTGSRALGYFDLQDRTRLITDASGVGLGAVLVQFNKEGIPRVIYYASKSLTDCEKRFSSTEREALAIVWAVERFRMYLLGIEFELETDHQPLVTIFGRHSRPCARIERWVLRLMAYRFKVIYCRGKNNVADALSRLTEDSRDAPFSEESQVFVRRVTEALALLSVEEDPSTFDLGTEACVRAIHESAALDVHEIEAATEMDDELQKLREAIDTDDWTDKDLRLYAPFKAEFGFTGSLIVRNTNLLIPKIHRARMLQLAHEGHPGQTAMKSRIRTCCWWPKIDQDVENFVSNCRGCLWTSLPDRPEAFKPRPLPSKPWVDLGLDYLGPLPTGESLLVVVDYYSRYMEVKIVKDQTAKTTKECLDEIFTRLGFPYTLQFDNARQLVSDELTSYCTENGIAWINTTPYWPQANGEVERQNRTLMKRLRIGFNSHGDWKAELRSFLKMYYTTPHSITGKAPTELLGRLIRSRLPNLSDLALKPPSSDFRDRDQLKKFLGEKRENERRRARTTDIKVGDTVLMKNLLGGNKFRLNFNKEEFLVVAMNGSHVTIKQKVGNKIFERNVSHLKKVPLDDALEMEPCDEPNEVDSDDHQSTQDQHQPTQDQQQPETVNERPHRATRAPRRMDDYQLN